MPRRRFILNIIYILSKEELKVKENCIRALLRAPKTLAFNAETENGPRELKEKNELEWETKQDKKKNKKFTGCWALPSRFAMAQIQNTKFSSRIYTRDWERHTCWELERNSPTTIGWRTALRSTDTTVHCGFPASYGTILVAFREPTHTTLCTTSPTWLRGRLLASYAADAKKDIRCSVEALSSGLLPLQVPAHSTHSLLSYSFSFFLSFFFLLLRQKTRRPCYGEPCFSLSNMKPKRMFTARLLKW